MKQIHLTRKRAVIGAFGIGLGLFAVYSLRPEPLQVESALVIEGQLRVTIDEDGRTRAVDRYQVTAPVSGQLQRITLREGERIRAGQVVARVAAQPLDVPALAEGESRLQRAHAHERAAAAALAQAEAAHVQAQRELERRRKLFDIGALSTEQIEQYELMVKTRAEAIRSARETVTVARADIHAAQTSVWSRAGGRSGSVDVVAPAAGTILRIPEYSQRIVVAGEPLLELGDATVLEAVVDVLSADAVRVQPGMTAALTDWGGEALTARVPRIEPAAFTRLSALGVEEQRVNVILDFDDCPETLGDSYHLQSSIVVWSSDRVLTVPASALFGAAGGWNVFVIDGRGRARKRNVDIGERGRERAQVLRGLTAGDRVILFPGDQIADGVKVRGNL